jgi:HSP20 family protein
MPTSLLPRRLAPRFSPPFARELDRLDANIRRMFENPFRPLPDLFVDAPQPIGWVPPVEIAEDDTKLTITAELPGIEPKHVHVELENDLLTIRGDKTEELTEDEEKKGTKYHVFERAYGTFLRAFTVPSTVDPEKVTATFDKGVLKVEMPKSKEPRPRGREIAVTSG